MVEALPVVLVSPGPRVRMTICHKGSDMESRTALVVMDMLNTYDHRGRRAADRPRGADRRAADRADRAGQAERQPLVLRQRQPGRLQRYSGGPGRTGAGRQAPGSGRTVRAAGGVRLPRRFGTASSTARPGVRPPSGRIETIVLAGQVTEQCVLYSALDAYVREFLGTGGRRRGGRDPRRPRDGRVAHDGAQHAGRAAPGRRLRLSRLTDRHPGSTGRQ